MSYFLKPEKEKLRLAFEKVKDFLTLNKESKMSLWGHFLCTTNDVFRCDAPRSNYQITQKLGKIVVDILLEHEKVAMLSFNCYALRIKVRASQELSTKFNVIVGDSYCSVLIYRRLITFYVGDIKIVIYD